jgi:DNA-binding SARP family transcriptional activator
MYLELLGVPRISGPHTGYKRLERKSAALLAYLALEGVGFKRKLAGLLWPDSPESTARNNLRQLLRRLREAVGEPCVEGRDPLQLRSGLVVDVLQLKAAFAAGEYPKAAASRGELLAECSYDDCSELEDWLAHQRRQVQHMQRRSLEEQIVSLEREGRLGEALECAQQVLSLDPTAEEACRQVMRLYCQLGDSAAALRTYRQVAEGLRRELGVEPSGLTTQLAREIEQHASQGKLALAPRQRPDVPLSVERPLVLAGRDREWAEMEAAHEACKHIFLFGEAGVGKSRLMTDFARSKGEWLSFAARPGDAHVPFSTHARSIRALVTRNPHARMQPWVRRELSRLVPELEDEPLPLPPPPEDKARFFRANFEFSWALCRHMGHILFEDAHYVDADSFELGISIQQRLLAESHGPHILTAMRPSEFTSPSGHAVIQQMINSGQAVGIQLNPLPPQAVRELIRGMRVPELERVADEIARYTGGNPLFIVETARHLLESGDFQGSFPKSMPPPGRVGPVIAQRLGRLSPHALRLARVIAVAQTDIRPELAAAVLELPLDQLAEPWRELEHAHILRGEWFTHDLLAETLLQLTPEPVRQALARRIASIPRTPR